MVATYCLGEDCAGHSRYEVLSHSRLSNLGMNIEVLQNNQVKIVLDKYNGFPLLEVSDNDFYSVIHSVYAKHTKIEFDSVVKGMKFG